MALSIQISDAEFTQIVASLSLPNRNGLMAEYIFGENEAKSRVNRAVPGSAAMTPVGVAAYGPNYAEIRSGPTHGSIGFDTGIVPPRDTTILVVARSTTTCPVYMSTNAPFTGLHNYLNAPSLYNSNSGAPPTVPTVQNPAHASFAFYAGSLPFGDKPTIRTYADGALTAATGTGNGGSLRPATPWMIGTTLANGGNGIARIAYAAAFDRVLTAAEIERAYLSLKAFLATRDVVVS